MQHTIRKLYASVNSVKILKCSFKKRLETRIELSFSTVKKSFTSTTQSSLPPLIRETSHKKKKKKKTFKRYPEPENKEESPESQRQWNGGWREKH